jgi:hypothetical protein
MSCNAVLWCALVGYVAFISSCVISAGFSVFPMHSALSSWMMYTQNARKHNRAQQTQHQKKSQQLIQKSCTKHVSGFGLIWPVHRKENRAGVLLTLDDGQLGRNMAWNKTELKDVEMWQISNSTKTNRNHNCDQIYAECKMALGRNILLYM